jgi:hypothetical protein
MAPPREVEAQRLARAVVDEIMRDAIAMARLRIADRERSLI